MIRSDIISCVWCIGLVYFAERKSKLAKRIRKEIVKVRRKLAIQKGVANSDLDESTQDTGGK